MKKKINVAHVFLTLNIGGMEKIGSHLIRKIDASKYSPFVVCLDELGFFGEQLRNEGIPVVALHKGQGLSFSLLLKLIRFFRQNNIEIVHTNNPSPHFWGGVAALLAGVRTRIHTKHGRNFIKVKRIVMINRFSAMLSQKIVSVSQDSADLTHKVEKVPLHKISTIFNGVDTDYFKKEDASSSLLEELGIPRDHLVVGSISRFSTDKDYETLILAFNALQKKQPQCTLLLVGDGETKEGMVKLVKDLGIESRVVFTGFRHDILAMLNLIDIFVLSTHTEGISIALLEAMATEKAVVATDVGGNGEIIEHGKNGLLVHENDISGLGDSLLSLVSRDEERSRLAKAARQRVLDKFSILKTVRQYEELYEECYNGNK